MYYGIRFITNEYGRIFMCYPIKKAVPINVSVNERVKKTTDSIYVKRIITLPTEKPLDDTQALEMAKEWWNNYVNERMIKLLEGD